jgi:hypothetical protein
MSDISHSIEGSNSSVMTPINEERRTDNNSFDVIDTDERSVESAAVDTSVSEGADEETSSRISGNSSNQ